MLRSIKEWNFNFFLDHFFYSCIKFTRMLFFLKTNKQCCAEVKFADKVFSEFVFYAHEYMHPCMYISRLWFGFSNIYKQEFPTTPRCKIYVPNFFHCAQLSIRCQAQHPPKPRWHNSAWIWIPRINVTFTLWIWTSKS